LHGRDADRQDEGKMLRDSTSSTKSTAASASFLVILLVAGKWILLLQVAFSPSEYKGRRSYFCNGVPGPNREQSSPEVETVPVKVLGSI